MGWKKDEFYTNSIRNSPFIGEKSKEGYLARLKSLQELFDKRLDKIIKDPQTYGEKIKEHYQNENTQKTVFTAILAAIKYTDMKATHRDLFNLWYKFYLKIRNSIERKVINNIPTERQIEAHVDWEDIIKKRDAMAKGTKQHILMSLITYIPPRRQLDWYNIKVYTKPNFKPTADHNYINLGWEKPYILLTDYKTAKFYGRWYKALTDPLLSILMQSLKKEPREYLFLDKYGKPYSKLCVFTEWTNAVIKRTCGNDKTTMNSLRHSFVSYLRRTCPNMTLAERAQISKDLGHSVYKMLGYDVRIEDYEEESVLSEG